MKLRELVEEFVDFIESEHERKHFAVYKNPTRKELQEIGNYFARFIVDFINKDVYAFHSNLLHTYVANHFGFEYNMSGSENFGYGIGTIDLKKNKIVDSKLRTDKSNWREFGRDKDHWIYKYLEL